MKGFVHSTESFGTVDGPGIRYVVFMQGCPLRCLYCHNPDTWKTNCGKQMTPEQILEEFSQNKAFYKKGGITVTGGEPLLQINFLIDLFKKSKKYEIHTCLDTSGSIYSEENQTFVKKLGELVKYTDLVMLDIKHIDSEKHKKLTGMGNENILLFAKYLESKNVPTWIRHVVVKGYTDDREDLMHLGEFVGKLKNIKALDVLPYHTMGVQKYKNLGLNYALESVDALTQDETIKAKKIILEGVKKARNLSV